VVHHQVLDSCVLARSRCNAGQSFWCCSLTSLLLMWREAVTPCSHTERSPLRASTVAAGCRESPPLVLEPQQVTPRFLACSGAASPAHMVLVWSYVGEKAEKVQREKPVEHFVCSHWSDQWWRESVLEINWTRIADAGASYQEGGLKPYKPRVLPLKPAACPRVLGSPWRALLCSAGCLFSR